MIRVAQLSDTHFLEADREPEGGFAYDTSAAFDAVFADIVDSTFEADMVVVTGDVADHGLPAQYEIAADAFDRFDVPVHLTPGNHDRDLPFAMGLGRGAVGPRRVLTHGNWCFLFVDSNAGVMEPDATGRLVDPADWEHRLHRNGSLGEREAGWVLDACASTAADHVFIWLHHPPSPTLHICEDAPYGAEWEAVLARPEAAKVRGIGGGHTHMPVTHTVADEVPVFVGPSFKNNFDLEAGTMLPPGWRSFDFHPDGSIESSLQLVDDDRWPRSPLPRSVHAFMTGELSREDFEAIVARKSL